jgi:putrescine aminotransferase
LSSPGQVFASLQRHGAPGTALGAKIAGSGAVEAQAAGAVVRLSDGREMIDFGSYGVSLLGHRHPKVLAAVSDQLARMPASTRTLANPVTAGLMADLAERFGEPLQRVWLGSDGADAVEVALKLARRRTGRQRILAVRDAFHGKTLGALALTFNPAFHVGLESMLGDHVTHIDPADECAVAREVADGQVAALVIEPIQGEGGV